jgi:hypothetical protein
MNAPSANTTPTRLLRGRIRNLRKTRRNQDFFFTASDRAKMGATALAAGLAGLGGVATGLSGMAMDTTEEADLLEFELDGTPIRAWVWQSVFQEGDEVEVVAERMDGIVQGYGIHRVSDQIVALHPHCSRGRNAHNKASFKLWIKIHASLLAATYLLIAVAGLLEKDAPILPMLAICILGGIASAAITGFIAYRISRKFIGFVRLAEGIFEGFGWGDVKDIDLPAITKRGKKPGEPAALGVLYFRYAGNRVDSPG